MRCVGRLPQSADAAQNVFEVGVPVGVIAALSPCTNPVSTTICNVLAAVKAGNSIVVCPHQHAVECTSRVVAAMDKVAVLGPARSVSQIELSKTDARILGINPPVRQSGDTKDTPGIVLASTTGIVGLESGVIVAARHIHMHTDDAERFGLKDKDKVAVRLDTERPMILEDVLVRVSDSFKLAMHIDADEGNSAGWKPGVTGVIVRRSRG